MRSNLNYLVIMAGGIGSRFWPYSRNNKPKQFLDFFGTGKSLLQLTIERFKPLIGLENILIVTNVRYRQLCLDQIPGLNPSQILCEPCRRNTAPCIAYAIAHIKNKVAPEDWSKVNMVVAPSDHLILNNAEFIRVIREGLDFVSHNDALLTLGMRPSRPETGYGYIQLGQAAGGAIHKVQAFTEKPNLELAKVFQESGEFLWNSGIFIWSLTSIMNANRKYLPILREVFEPGESLMATEQEEAFVQHNFPKCPNISIDYGIMEKADNVYVLPADFGWSDLGTWGSLYALSDKDAAGNVSLHSEALFYQATGNIVTLERGKLAVVEGVDDMIIAENDGVLLICKKADEQSIKNYVNAVTESYGERYS